MTARHENSSDYSKSHPYFGSDMPSIVEHIDCEKHSPEMNIECDISVVEP